MSDQLETLTTSCKVSGKFHSNLWSLNECNLLKVGALPRDASVEVEAVAMVGTVSSISIIVRIDNVIVKLSVVIVINQQKY